MNKKVMLNFFNKLAQQTIPALKILLISGKFVNSFLENNLPDCQLKFMHNWGWFILFSSQGATNN
jgi:hypothetical protein